MALLRFARTERISNGWFLYVSILLFQAPLCNKNKTTVVFRDNRFPSQQHTSSNLTSAEFLKIGHGHQTYSSLCALLTADPRVTSSIPARYHTFVEIDHEIISTVILLPSADSFKKGCCQLQAKVCAQITG